MKRTIFIIHPFPSFFFKQKNLIQKFITQDPFPTEKATTQQKKVIKITAEVCDIKLRLLCDQHSIILNQDSRYQITLSD